MQRSRTRTETPLAARKTRRLAGWLTALALGAAVNGGTCFVHEPDVDPAFRLERNLDVRFGRAALEILSESITAGRC